MALPTPKNRQLLHVKALDTGYQKLKDSKLRKPRNILVSNFKYIYCFCKVLITFTHYALT